MTEYWVSQGNKWCDFCKIFISNNSSTIRNHELGQRHRENVSKRLDTLRKESAAKEKEKKEAARAMQQIELKANRCYQKDISNLKEIGNAHALATQKDGQEDWEFDGASGYHHNQSNGLYYDSNSGFYYADVIGRWVTKEEAYATVHGSSEAKRPSLFVLPTSSLKGNMGAALQNGPSRVPPPRPSSVAATKRKRHGQEPKAISEEEKAAIRARDAARKRVEEREMPLLGLYKR